MGIIVDQKFLVKFNKKNKEHFENKGYEWEQNKIVEINVVDMFYGSHTLVKCICDFCGAETYKEFRWFYIDRGEGNNISKMTTCCDNLNCIHQKMEQTSIIRYGTKHPTQSKIVQDKIEQTNIEKYGVKCVFQSPIIQETMKNTWMENYGVDNPWKAESVKDKIKETLIENYGVEYITQNKEIMERVVISGRKTLYNNGTAPSSSQQEYIHELLGGEKICKLNYPVDRCSLDIAFPNEMFYIEYDGGGHGWGTITNGKEKEFKDSERKRKGYLEHRDWKLIRIISKKDKLFEDTFLLYLIKECKDYLLNSNHTWIEIDIDENEIRCSKYIKKISEEELRTFLVYDKLITDEMIEDYKSGMIRKNFFKKHNVGRKIWDNIRLNKGENR